MIARLLAIGLVSMLGQVILLRELNVAFFGSELIYALAFGVWLFWSAMGALLGRRRGIPSDARVRWALLALACALPAAVLLTRGLRRLSAGVPGAFLPFPLQISGMMLCLLPVGLLLGLLFQWVAKRFAAEGGTLAAAYAIESVGGIAGGVLATVLPHQGMQNFTAALVCATLALVAAAHPWRRERPRGLATALVLCAGLLAVGSAWRADLDSRSTGWNHAHLLVSRDSPYGRTTLTRAAGQLTVFDNDALAFDSESASAEELVHLAAIQHDKPQSVMILGGGVEGLVREVLLHRPRRVDSVELDPFRFELVLGHLPPEHGEALAAAQVRLSVGDPRRAVRRAGRHDLILIGMPEPGSGRTNRFYTREFFRLCAEHLAPRGVLAFRLPGAGNFWTRQQTRRAASILRAMREVFPDSLVLPADTLIFIASASELERDPARLAGRLRERGIEGDLVFPAYVDYLYTNDRFIELERRLAASSAPINSDRRPICYQYTLLIWLSQFYPAVALLDLPLPSARDLARSPAVWSCWLVLGIVAWLARRRDLWRRSLLAGIAGLTGMVLEIALILHYQTVSGVLYSDLGLLLTAFMVGLAIGAAGVHRWLGGPAVSGSGARRGGMLLLAGFVGLCVLTAGLLHAGLPSGLPATAGLLLVGGFFVAALFAFASLDRRPEQRSVVSPLYAADLAGGCAGSLVATLLLVPVVGLPGSILLLVPVLLSALILL